MNFHPISELFPLMQGREFDAGGFFDVARHERD